MNSEKKNNAIGLISVLIASFLLGILSTLCKQLLNNGMSSQSLVFLRYALSGIMLAVIMKFTKIPFKVTKRELGSLILFCGIGGCVTSSLLSLSYTYMYSGIATMFHFSYPIFVTLIMIILFKEKPTWKIIAAVVLAVGGMILMADINGNYSPVGIILAVSSGLGLAIYIVATKKSCLNSIHPIKIIFYMSVIATVVLGALLLIRGNFTPPSCGTDWLRIISVALFCTVFAHTILSSGIKKLGATKSSVISMIEPFISVLAGAIVIHEIPSKMAVLGCALILTAIVLVTIQSSSPKTT